MSVEVSHRAVSVKAKPPVAVLRSLDPAIPLRWWAIKPLLTVPVTKIIL